MKKIEKLQFQSVMTTVISSGFNTIRDIVVIRLLSSYEYGLFGIVQSLMNSALIYQNLGLRAGLITQFAKLRFSADKSQLFQFMLIIRIVTGIFVGGVLYLLADYFAFQIYESAELAGLIRIITIGVLLMGILEIATSMITSLGSFRTFFLTRIIVAVGSIPVFYILGSTFGVEGLLYALIVVASITLVVFMGAIFKVVGFKIDGVWQVRNWSRYIRPVLKIGVVVYISRLAYIIWERIPLLGLGYIFGIEVAGVYNMAMFLGLKFNMVVTSLAFVNLPVMSSEFANDENNDYDVIRNFVSVYKKIFVILLFGFVTVVFFSNDLVVWVVGDKFIRSLPYVLPVMASFLVWSNINVINTSLLIPSHREKVALINDLSMLILSGFSGVVAFFLYRDPVVVVWGASIGAIISVVFIMIRLRKILNTNFCSWEILLLLVVTLSLLVWASLGLPLKIAIFGVYIIVWLVLVDRLDIHRLDYRNMRLR